MSFWMFFFICSKKLDRVVERGGAGSAYLPGGSRRRRRCRLLFLAWVFCLDIEFYFFRGLYILFGVWFWIAILRKRNETALATQYLT